MIEAFDMALDDRRSAMFASLLEADPDFVGRAQVDRDAAAVIARKRLYDDRLANSFGHPNRL